LIACTVVVCRNKTSYMYSYYCYLFAPHMPCTGAHHEPMARINNQWQHDYGVSTRKNKLKHLLTI